MSFINNIMGWMLAQLSGLFNHNFAASVLVFTILINIVMVPFTLKTQKSTAKQAKLKPKLDALKKKYGSDKKKYSQAMSELYTKEGVSMSGGCLPMIVRLVIMFGVYGAVMSPISYIAQVDKAAVSAAKNWSAYVSVAESNNEIDWQKAGIEEVKKSDNVTALVAKYGSENKSVDYYAKLTILDNANSLKKDDVQDGSVEKKIRDVISKKKSSSREVELVDKVKHNAIIMDNFIAKGGTVEQIDKINFNLFNLDLTLKPNFSWNFSNFNRTWIIPIVSFLASLASSLASMGLQKKANPESPNMVTMTVMMSLFSLYIAFTMPCAVGFYWICSSLIAGGIQILTQIFYGPNIVIAKEQAKSVIARSKQEKAKIVAADK